MSAATWGGFGALPTNSVAELKHPAVLENASKTPGTVEVTITAAAARLSLRPRDLRGKFGSIVVEKGNS